MSFLGDIQNFFTPKPVKSSASPMQDPTYMAKKYSTPNTSRGAVNLINSVKTYKPTNTTTGALNLIKSAPTYKPRDTTKGATNLIKSVAAKAKPKATNQGATVQAAKNNGAGSNSYGTVDLNNYGMGSGGGSSSGGMDLGGMSAMDLLNMDLSPDEIAALRAQAQITAKSQNDIQRQSLDTLQKQADNLWSGDQQRIKNIQADSQQQLENQSFQDYLQSRQSIADRGLASSGLAEDANTRLMLNRNDALAGLMRQTDAETADAKKNYDTNTTDLTSKRALLNDETTSNSIYQDLYNTALSNKQKQAQMKLDLYKFMNPSGDTQYKANADMNIANSNNATKWNIAQANNQTKLTINENNNATDLQKTSMNIQQQMNALDSTNWNRSQTQVAGLAKQKYSQAASILAALSKDPGNKDLQKTYNQAIASANDTANEVYKNASSFNYSSGGSGAAGNAAYQQNLQKAYGMGLNPAWGPVMSQIVSRESSFNPNAKNPKSTAYGYGQFLRDTRNQYEAKTGLSYNDPASQLVMMGQYIKDRYGTPQNALAFWNANHWY